MNPAEWRRVANCGRERKKVRRVMLREMHEVKYLDFGDGVDLVEIVVRSVTYITCVVLEFGKEGK